MKKSILIAWILACCLFGRGTECLSQDERPRWKMMDDVQLFLPDGNSDVEVVYVGPCGRGRGRYLLRSKTGKPFTGRDFHGGYLVYDPPSESIGAILEPVCLDGSDLRGFICIGIDCNEKMSLRDADLQHAEFRTYYAHNWDVTGADIRYAELRLRSDQLRSTKSYRMRDLTGWDGAIHLGFGSEAPTIKDVDFRGFDLSRAIFRCSVPGCDFTDAVISGANCSGLTLEQIKQTWNYKHGHMESVIVSDEVKAALEAEKVTEESETNETPEESKAESDDSKATEVVESSELEKEKPLAESAKTAD